MAFCLDLGLDGLNRADLSGLYGLDLDILTVKSIFIDRELGDGWLGFRLDTLDLVHIDSRFVDIRQGHIDTLELGVLGIKDRVVANQMEHDLGHAARFAVLGPRKNDVLHLAAAKALCPLLAQHPGHRVRHVGLAAPVGADDRRYTAARKNDLGMIGK